VEGSTIQPAATFLYRTLTRAKDLDPEKFILLIFLVRCIATQNINKILLVTVSDEVYITKSIISRKWPIALWLVVINVAGRLHHLGRSYLVSHVSPGCHRRTGRTANFHPDKELSHDRRPYRLCHGRPRPDYDQAGGGIT
jgi:hypothetical protein